MEINILNQLKQTAQAFGVMYHRYKDQISIEKDGDMRLFHILGIKPDFTKSIENAAELCEEGILYVVIDRYHLYYMSFLYEETIIALGPFVVNEAEEFLPEVMDINQIPVIFQKELQEFYNSLPLVKELTVLESLVMMNMRYLFPEQIDIKRIYVENFTYEVTTYDELQHLEEHRISMQAIEYRYKIEERFMSAISSGDIEKVMEIEKELSNYRLTPRAAGEFRNKQNFLIILNTLMRRAVQNADVHPAHIDSLSTSFANKIEVAKNETDLRKISREMTRRYCLLVRNYSLIGHSDMVRDVMNYIDFNLTEDLSLNAIADKISVSASYLSKQFKKENEKTLTDYVNGKRMYASLKYLAATDLPIQSVAELVGIYDENYFSRLFKRYQQMTPSKYRSLMKGE